MTTPEKETRHTVRAEGVTTLTISISIEIKEALRTLAIANERVFSDYVRKVLRDHVSAVVGDTGQEEILAEKIAEAKRLLIEDKVKLRLLKK